MSIRGKAFKAIICLTRDDKEIVIYLKEVQETGRERIIDVSWIVDVDVLPKTPKGHKAKE